ncbi:hypothetical protein [Streptomyces sp. NPDC086519]|uniref:hypothetical protein n=1 Tax=Streptomyces sp. NPDC086519 TaxID=3154863 RepID=UPI003447E181
MTVQGCKLNRRLINKWVRALRVGLPAEEQLDFSTTRAITTYKSNSIDGLAQALAESTEPGDVEVVDNLVIFASNIRHRSNGDPQRVARVSITPARYASCTISGDPSWVNAQTAILHPLLKEARPRKWWIWYAPRAAWTSWGASLALLISSFFHSTPLSVLSAVAGMACGFTIGSILKRILRVEIWLTRDDFTLSYWRFTANEVVTSIIALIAIAVAVIFGFIAHKDTQKESIGKVPTLTRSL